MLGNRRIVQRKLKVASDENTVKSTAPVKANVQQATRAALGDVSNNRKSASALLKGKAVDTGLVEKPAPALVNRRTASSTTTGVVQRRQSVTARPPIRPSGRSISSVLATSTHNASGAPVRPLPARARTLDTISMDVTQSTTTTIVNEEMETENCEVETELEVTSMEDIVEVEEPAPSKSSRSRLPPAPPIEDDEEMDEDDWTFASPKTNAKYQAAIEEIKATFKDEIDEFDLTMVSEYAEEIFAYMGKLELECMPNPTYMDGQSEIEWSMRKTLIDWLLQVHLRYHMLPETLWIAVNIVDRFLSRRVVSLVKLQLVGVTAMFIASKYEEIMAPSVDEFAFMTENGYTREEILKGEKIILQTLDFNVSPYCSPYSWVRRISKADDYDIQTRTLCKFLMEVTLLDHRFLRAKPSMIAAIGMYTAKRMLQGTWDDAFVFYSEFTEEQLVPGFNILIEDLAEAGFEHDFVCKKYANKKFLKASLFAREWALSFTQS